MLLSCTYKPEGRQEWELCSPLPFSFFKQESIIILPSGSGKQELGCQGLVILEDDSNYAAGQVSVCLSSSGRGEAEPAAQWELSQCIEMGKTVSCPILVPADPAHHGQ